jgi:hypothetical protein
MIFDKIFYILNSFNNKDWNDFGKYVSSPYLVNGKFSKNIFIPIKKFFLNIKNKEKITLYAFEKKLDKIRLAQKYTENSFLVKLSAFYNHLEHYLILTNFNNDYMQKQKYLLFELLNRKLDYNIEKEINHFNKSAESKVSNTFETVTLQEIYFSEAVYFLKHNNNKRAFELFYKQSEKFIAYFLEGFIYHLIEFKNIEKYKTENAETLLQIFNYNFDLDSYINEIEKLNSDSFNIALTSYYLLRISEQNNIETNIEKLKKVFFKNEESYEVTFRVFVYIELGASFQKIINKGNTKYYKENFELLKRQDSNNLIIHIQKGIFALNFFFSSIELGLKMNETKWVENFINKYYKQLPEDIKHNDYQVGIAMLQFHKKEFEESLKTLQKCKNIFYSKTDFRYSILMLKILYETSRFEEAYLELDRLSHRITNNKNISSDIKQKAKYFIQSYSKLLKISLDPEKLKIDDLYVFIEKNEEQIPEKDWFILKIKNLKRDIKL